MTNNYRQKTTQAARYQEHRSDWTTKTCDDQYNIIVMKPALH